MMHRLVATLVLLFAAVCARAENFDVYPFESQDEEARFERLTHELRCPKCQNQSIADSNAPIAQDLRKRTYELVREGRSDDEVVSYLKERYGEFITYKPAFNAVTSLLWGGPFLLLAVVVVVLLLRRRRLAAASGTDVVAPVPVQAPDPRQVRDILARYDEEDRR